MKDLKCLDKIKRFKNDQSIILVIALMLVTAGYYNYLGREAKEKNIIEVSAVQNQEEEKIGEAKFVDSQIENENNYIDEENSLSLSNNNSNVNNGDLDNEENKEGDNQTIDTASINTNENNDLNNISNTDNNVNNDNTSNTDNLDALSNNTDYFTNCRLEREKMYSQMLDVYQKILESSTISEEQKSIASNEIVKINNTKNAIMVCEDLIKNKDIQDCVIFINGDSVNIIVQTNELTEAKTAQIGNILTRELKVIMENVHIVKK